MSRLRFLVTLLAISLCGALFSGCQSANPAEPLASPIPEDPLAQAAAEATALIQKAQATAIILQARATASALVAAAGPQDTPQAGNPSAAQTPAPGNKTPSLSVSASGQEQSLEEVSLVGVGFAAEGAYLNVQFTAPPDLARAWQIGQVYIIDEATGKIYDQVPIMPVLGALFGKPKEPGQIGYVMFLNVDPPLQNGALVTVVLGDNRWEHISLGQ